MKGVWSGWLFIVIVILCWYFYMYIVYQWFVCVCGGGVDFIVTLCLSSSVLILSLYSRPTNWPGSRSPVTCNKPQVNICDWSFRILSFPGALHHFIVTSSLLHELIFMYQILQESNIILAYHFFYPKRWFLSFCWSVSSSWHKMIFNLPFVHWAVVHTTWTGRGGWTPRVPLSGPTDPPLMSHAPSTTNISLFYLMCIKLSKHMWYIRSAHWYKL